MIKTEKRYWHKFIKFNKKCKNKRTFECCGDGYKRICGGGAGEAWIWGSKILERMF